MTDDESTPEPTAPAEPPLREERRSFTAALRRMHAPRPKSAPRTWKRTTIAKGIRRDATGFEAYVRAGGRQVSKRFNLETPLRKMQEWRDLTRHGLELAAIQRTPPALKPVSGKLLKSLDGWCYVYFIQDGATVKIGRTNNPYIRLSELQTAHHRALTLVCAVPAHYSLEAAVHARFAHCRASETGEWFNLEPDLVEFIQRLQDGVNPVALLW